VKWPVILDKDGQPDEKRQHEKPVSTAALALNADALTAVASVYARPSHQIPIKNLEKQASSVCL
jgi:hypothetical protein